MKVVNFVKKYKYTSIFLIIVACYIPFLINYYPGIVCKDSLSQIKQAMGISGLNNHHPILQIFIWKIFVKIGNLFNSDYLIVFLNSIFQILSVAGVFTYSKFFLDKNDIKSRFLPIFYCLYPTYALYSIYTSKDLMFSVVILLFTIQLAKIIISPSVIDSKKDNLMIITSAILVTLYKNNGIFIVLSSLIAVLVIYKKYFKQLLKIFFIIITFFIFWNQIFFKLMHIDQTEQVESLGLPLIQMSYLVKFNYDNMTNKEINEIDNYVDVSILQENYHYKTIDNYKRDFNVNYYNSNKLQFFKLWFKLVLKYPKECLNATSEKMRLYFKPYLGFPMTINNNDSNIINIKNVNIYENNYMNISLNHIYKSSPYWVINKIKQILFSAAYNLYMLIIITIYVVLKRNKGFILLIPSIMIWLTTIAAPNTIYRYVYPSFFCFPFICYFIFGKRNNIS